MDMTSIAVDREAYNLLRHHKRPGESFSQVVKRLADRREPLSRFVGAWKDLPDELFRQLEQERTRSRALDERRFRRVLRGQS